MIETAQASGLTDTQIERGATPSRAEAQRLSTVSWTMRGIVTSDGWKYTYYPRSDEVEMYDLNADPYEEQNVAGTPGFEAQQAHLHDLFLQYRSCDGAGCR